MKVFTSLAILLILWQCPTNTQAFNFTADHICSKIEKNTILSDIHAFYFFEDKIHILDGDNFYIAEFRATGDGKSYQVVMPKEYSVRVVKSKSYVNRINLVDVYKNFFPFTEIEHHVWVMPNDDKVTKFEFYTFDLKTFERKPVRNVNNMNHWVVDNLSENPGNYVLDKSNTDGYYVLKDIAKSTYRYVHVRYFIEKIALKMKGEDTIPVHLEDFDQQQLFNDHFGEKPPFGVFHTGHLILMASNKAGVGIYGLESRTYNFISYKDFFDCSGHQARSKAYWVIPVFVVILIAVVWVSFANRRKKTKKGYSTSIDIKTTRQVNKVQSAGTSTKPTATTTFYSSPRPNTGADLRKNRTF